MPGTVKKALKRSRSTVETVLEHGRATVETAIGHGRATMEDAIHHGRATVESAIHHGRATVETALEHGMATMQAAILHGREDIRIESVPIPQAGPGELIVQVGAALTCGTDLKVFRRGYHARMIVPLRSSATNLRARSSKLALALWTLLPAIASSRSTPLPAATATSVNAARRISATICSSTTAHTLSSFASPLASSLKTRYGFRITCLLNMPRSLSRWPAPCTASRIATPIPVIPSPSSAAARSAS